MTSPRSVTPETAAALLRNGAARLIDVREPDEHARARIPGATNLPLGRLGASAPEFPPGTRLLVHCRSGARTTANAERIQAWAGDCEVSIVEGGLDAWKRAGLPVTEDRAQPIELMRQVQIVAGSMVVAGVLLGVLVAPAFLAIAGFVGAGLVFAGVTGSCGLASILRRMPWNNRGLPRAV